MHWSALCGHTETLRLFRMDFTCPFLVNRAACSCADLHGLRCDATAVQLLLDDRHRCGHSLGQCPANDPSSSCSERVRLSFHVTKLAWVCVHDWHGKKKSHSCLLYRGYVDTMHLLVSRNANPNMSDGKGWTPLMHAARTGRQAVGPLGRFAI